MSTWRKVGCCLVAAVAAFGAFGYEDEFISTSDETVRTNWVGDEIVYVFTNAAAVATVTLKQTMVLENALVVGGGGAGGNTVGGGGGGGSVAKLSGRRAIQAEESLTVEVGAGGVPLVTKTFGLAGLSGASSTLAFADGTSLVAAGGGGGGGWSAAPTAAEGEGYCPGGTGGGNAANGGGGAAAAASGGRGGEGVVSAIAGAEAVYGSGGGGGSKNNTGGSGGTNAGNGAGAGSGRRGYSGTPGKGGGGGGGAALSSVTTADGGDGGSGTVILRFATRDMTKQFACCPIDDQRYTGAEVRPSVKVVLLVGGTELTAGQDYTLAYENNVLPGTARVVATGVNAYSGYEANGTFTILNEFEDENIIASRIDFQRLRLGDRYVYIITNTEECTFSIKRNLTLKDALVVGGGGSGGYTAGGGGGGGGVTVLDKERLVPAGDALTVKVGAGGINTVSGWSVQGLQGETSTLTFTDGVSLFAYGGGGGGCYQGKPSSAKTVGHIASGGGGGSGASVSGGEPGVNYNPDYGTIGGTSSASLGGGGGGAFSAATGANGGEGVTNAITGAEVVYGSGGGGGAKDAGGTPGRGGTNAGAGVNANAARRGYSGVPCTGGGGGGGANASSQEHAKGGDGASGIVVLSFVEGGEVGQPTIAEKALTYPDGITQPKVSFALGNEIPGALFSAQVTVSFYTNATGGAKCVLDTLEFNGVGETESREGLGRFFVEPGIEVFVDMTVESSGATPVSGSVSAEAVGEKPACAGHGGGSRVIHVRPGATGRGDGTSWFDAYTDFREALKDISAERPEIWFAGDESGVINKSTLNPETEAWIRGGFTGVEDRQEERVKGTKSSIDLTEIDSCFKFANTNAVTLDGFDMRGAQTANVSKSGAGDLTITNCVIGNTSSRGNGLYVNGGAESTVKVVDVLFTRIFYVDIGTAARFESVGRVVIDSCAFTANGCEFSVGYNNTMCTSAGAAIYAKNAPLTVLRTRFAGNRSQALTGGSYGAGGVFRLVGDCGATAFTNCLFVGNETIHAFASYYYSSPATGMLVFAPSKGTLDLVNCTFAHGVAEVSEGAAGVSVRSGTANIRNCIFYGNTNGVTNTAGFDVDVASGATANIACSLFEDRAPRRISCAEGGTTNCTGLVYGKPFFVTDMETGSCLVKSGNMMKLDPTRQGEFCAFNCHLRGGSGYVDEATGEKVKTWAKAKWRSPAVDAGDPSQKCVEPTPNGRRVNMGAYGNTPWATMSGGGTMLFVR